MMCSEIAELASLEALGILDAADEPALAAHLVDCETCRTDLAGRRAAVSVIGYDVPAAEPPPRLRVRVMERFQEPAGNIGPDRHFPSVGSGLALFRSWAMSQRLYAAAAVVLAVGLGWSIGRIQGLNTELASERVQVVRLTTDLAHSRHRLEMLADRDVRVLAMSGQRIASAAHGTLVWSPQMQAVMIIVDRLPVLSGDKTYQLWAETAATKASLGTFQPDAEGHVIVDFGTPGTKGMPAIAVTIEPHGGMPRPTGEVALQSRI